MIIGLTGRNAAGKGAAADFLKSKGFTFHSLSDVIREEVKRRGLELTRDALIATGPELRAHLLAIRADAPIRFERIKARGRESDPRTLEEYNRIEQAESSSLQQEGQNLTATEAVADVTLDNNGTPAEFQVKLGELVPQLMAKMKRPGWDDYFMKMATVAALRSNCVKRKVAAVIVREKRVISTGYNGTPRGTKNCYEGGCPRCNQLTASGTKLDECLCSHGEENAITQAAYHGVSIARATIYTTFAPCLMCTKMIINGGLHEVVYNMDYPLNETSFKLLKDAGVVCRKLKVG